MIIVKLFKKFLLRPKWGTFTPQLGPKYLCAFFLEFALKNFIKVGDIGIL